MKKLFLSLTKVHTHPFIGKLTLFLIFVLSALNLASAQAGNTIPLDVSKPNQTAD
jgi:hypothetical protein